MKKALTLLVILASLLTANATIHVVNVWDGYFQFLPGSLTIQLGDTVQWLPLDNPSMVHTITSTNIPSGAVEFDQIWQAPADTFFQYIPLLPGSYEYECTPHAVSFNMIGSITVQDGTTGIPVEAISASDLLIYPNPSADVISFSESDFVYAFNIFSAKGKLVRSGTTEEIVDISILANGIYHVQILAEKPRFLKFVKR